MLVVNIAPSVYHCWRAWAKPNKKETLRKIPVTFQLVCIRLERLRAGMERGDGVEGRFGDMNRRISIKTDTTMS